MSNTFIPETRLPQGVAELFDAIYLVAPRAYTPVRLYPRTGAVRAVFDGKLRNLIVEVDRPEDPATQERILRRVAPGATPPVPVRTVTPAGTA